MKICIDKNAEVLFKTNQSKQEICSFVKGLVKHNLGISENSSKYGETDEIWLDGLGDIGAYTSLDVFIDDNYPSHYNLEDLIIAGDDGSIYLKLIDLNKVKGAK
jgi:hypothetical protein